MSSTPLGLIGQNSNSRSDCLMAWLPGVFCAGMFPGLLDRAAKQRFQVFKKLLPASNTVSLKKLHNTDCLIIGLISHDNQSSLGN